MTALQTFDGSQVLRKGTRKKLRIIFTAQATDGVTSPTVTIATGGTFTLLDTTGTPVSGFNAVPITGADSGALAVAQAWFVLDTATVPVGYYVAVFEVEATGSDGLLIEGIPEIQIEVRSTTADFFTFDPTTPVGTVRMLIADIDPSDFTFNDVEIGRFITLEPTSLYCAAARAFETWARTQSRVSGQYRASDGSMVKRRTSAEMIMLAKDLRDAPLRGALVTGTINVSSPNELLDSFRQEWHDINALPDVQ